MNNTIMLTEAESNAVRAIQADDFSDPIGLIERMGYDPKVFFVGGRFGVLDLRGSDIKGVSFQGAQIERVIIRSDQREFLREGAEPGIREIDVQPTKNTVKSNPIDATLKLTSPVLGTNQSQDDINLFDVFVDEQNNMDQPIIVGRWGTGKTSLLLKRAEPLSRLLIDGGNSHNRPWFIDESDIRLDFLLAEIQDHQVDRNTLNIAISELWEGEIILRVIWTLQLIWKKFAGELQSESWDFISNEGLAMNNLESPMKNRNLHRDLISRVDDLNQDSTIELKRFRSVLSKSTMMHIFECIQDLKRNQIPRPIILIESIEAPHSRAHDNEKNDLNSDVVSSLLNVWYQRFRPERRDVNISVNISIPWTRYYPERTSFPDKISNYTCHTNWLKRTLRTLILKRLAWEVEKAGGRLQLTHQFGEIWSRFFVEGIESVTSTSWQNRTEDSFDYLCKYSSWRPRDLIILIRECIEEHCRERNMSHSEFFSRADKISSTLVRRVASNFCQRTASARVVEYVERSGRAMVVAESMLHGLSSPIDIKELVSSFLRSLGVSGGPNEASLLTELWNAEIIGLAVEFNDLESEVQFSDVFGKDVVRNLNGLVEGEGVRDVRSVAFLFRYSTAEFWNVNAIMARYQNHKIVINPLFDEYFGINVTSDYPIGI